jgi:endonuclease-8
MPEGDTVHRAARTLHRALAGHTVTRFETALAPLAVADAHTPLVGQDVLGVTARGKHLLIQFSGGLTLRTHQRMSGSWHVYRPGERWWRRPATARVVIGTRDFDAVAFDMPVAEFVPTEALDRHAPVSQLGPDLLGDPFDEAAAVARLRVSAQGTVADALLDQRAVAGLGNVFKSELLFLAGIPPATPPALLTDSHWLHLVREARRLLRLNVSEPAAGAWPSARGRRTTGRVHPHEGLWVYRRRGQPCRRCGTVITVQRHGAGNRITYLCPSCQSALPGRAR